MLLSEFIVNNNIEIAKRKFKLLGPDKVENPAIYGSNHQLCPDP